MKINIPPPMGIIPAAARVGVSDSLSFIEPDQYAPVIKVVGSYVEDYFGSYEETYTHEVEAWRGQNLFASEGDAVDAAVHELAGAVTKLLEAL